MGDLSVTAVPQYSEQQYLPRRCSTNICLREGGQKEGKELSVTLLRNRGKDPGSGLLVPRVCLLLDPTYWGLSSKLWTCSEHYNEAPGAQMWPSERAGSLT